MLTDAIPGAAAREAGEKLISFKCGQIPPRRKREIFPREFGREVETDILRILFDEGCPVR